jgi:copper(I)-binding protein
MMRLVLPAATAALLTLVSAISFARAAEATAGDLAISSAWARATPPGAETGAVYLTIENHGEADDRIVSAASPVARSVEPHQAIEEDGMVKMRPLTDPLVPAGGKLEMQPGGTHMMLVGLSAPLRAGERIPLTLVFEAAGAVTLDLQIAPLGADAPVEGHTLH